MRAIESMNEWLEYVLAIIVQVYEVGGRGRDEKEGTNEYAYEEGALVRSFFLSLFL